MWRSSGSLARAARVTHAVAIVMVLLVAACSHPSTSPTSPATPSTVPGTSGSAPAAAECNGSRAGWIWCDDFEQDRLGSYFEYNDAQGSFVRVSGVGMGGSFGMRVKFASGQVDAGSLHLAM